MKILVCIKQILDPEIPAREFRINSDGKRAEQGSANLVTNIFCENALETALQFRDGTGGEITALSYGPLSAEDSLRKALALKVDHAYLVADEEGARPDSLPTAKVLAAAVRKIGDFDLIMVGREAGDWGAGQAGGLLAEELGVPCVAFVDTVEATAKGELKLRRQTETGWEAVAARPPLVVTITNNDENVPRIPKTRDIMMSHRKPLTTWSLEDLGMSRESLQTDAVGCEVADLFIPKTETICEFAEGDSLDDKLTQFATNLAEVIRSV